VVGVLQLGRKNARFLFSPCGESKLVVYRNRLFDEKSDEKANNRSLVDLDLRYHSISNDNWNILCESLKAHPTLTCLNLLYTSPSNPSDEQKAHRTRAIAEMMKESTVLHTIHYDRDERDDQIYAESILPHLESNLYRPRVQGIKKADIALRRPLLGRALQTNSVRNKSNLLWMLLSGNPDVVVRLIE
jgi:hypothetical protein